MKIKEPRHISLDLTNYFNLSSVGTAAVVTRTVAMTSIREFVVKLTARKGGKRPPHIGPKKM